MSFHDKGYDDGFFARQHEDFQDTDCKLFQQVFQETCVNIYIYIYIYLIRVCVHVCINGFYMFSFFKIYM